MRRIAIFILVSTFCLQGFAQSEGQYKKAKIVEDIYDQIGRTVKDSRRRPTFIFMFNSLWPVHNAWYDPTNNTISFGEGLYDLATQFGEDSLNAIAGILGHELAHFYKDHGWGYSFGMANPATDISQDIYELQLTTESKASMEAEADYFGGIFCHLSGYNSLEVIGPFFDLMYEELEIPDSTFGYPTRQDRGKIADNTKILLTNLLPVFDAANMANVLQEYDLAASLYDHIIGIFPSREIYNNAGVALAKEALSLFPPEELLFVYPFGLDMDTRLSFKDRGSKGQETLEQRRAKLMELSLEYLEHSIQVDKSYATAYINLSLLHSLMKEPEMAIAMAVKGVKLAKEQESSTIEANGQIAKGIALAQSDQKKSAMEAFKVAEKANKAFSEVNVAVLSGEQPFGFKRRKKKKKEPVNVPETINDLEPSLIEIALMDAKTMKINKQNRERPDVTIAADKSDEYSAMLVKSFSFWTSNIAMVTTPPNYAKKSAKGIGIGDATKTLYEKYGQPAWTSNAVSSQFHVYQSPNIMFSTDSNGKVSSWSLYQIQK